jgi:hypothetical protein
MLEDRQRRKQVEDQVEVMKIVRAGTNAPEVIFTKDDFFSTATTVLIRATNTSGFRCGEWAQVVSIVWDRRLCYKVVFIDKVTDIWPVYDPSDPYEIKVVE